MPRPSPAYFDLLFNPSLMTLLIDFAPAEMHEGLIAGYNWILPSSMPYCMSGEEGWEVGAQGSPI